MNENKTLQELNGGEKEFCYGCGIELSDKKLSEIFVDLFFFEVLGGVFCSEHCRDSYLDSK